MQHFAKKPIFYASVPLTLFILISLCHPVLGQGFLQNIALNKPYNLDPRPNYWLRQEDQGKIKLTDGIYDEDPGWIWLHLETVGWNERRPVIITVDLGQQEPIAGVSYNTAAGKAGVTWPDLIFIFVSDNARQWWEAGELVALSEVNGKPPVVDYAIHRYWTEALETHGRYLAFVVWSMSGPFCFSDEIEIYRGPLDLLNLPRHGQPIDHLRNATVDRAVRIAYHADIKADFKELRERVTAAPIAATERQAIEAELDRAEAECAVGVNAMTGDTRAILPYFEAHARGLAIQSKLWRAAGHPKFQVWSCCPWDPLSPTSLSPKVNPKPSIEVTLMQNEVRGAVLNFTNASDRAVEVEISYSGRVAEEFLKGIAIHEVAWTRLRYEEVTGSALPLADRSDKGWIVHAPAGMTRQIWLSIYSREIPVGKHESNLLLTLDGNCIAKVPILINVSKLLMPDELTLSLGGWDYSDYTQYGINKSNRESAVEFLRQYHVTAPWASSFAVPFGKHNNDGKMTDPPNTDIMDAWLDLWQDARDYCIFLAFRDDLPDTLAARTRIGDWITFWVEHLGKRGIEPSQIFLHLVDEPRNEEMDQRVIDYAEVIRAAQPLVNIWINPVWKDPTEATPELFEAANMICANRWLWIANREPHEQLLLAHQRAGRDLAFYSCWIPVRKYDPYTYFRLQAWDCFRYGMLQETFWSFGDNGGGSSWVEHASKSVCATPQFLDNEGCTTSKQMEAIREGLYDHEYLVMLRDLITEFKKIGYKDHYLTLAKELLTDGPREVLEAPGAENGEWAISKERNIADNVRLKIIKVLFDIITKGVMSTPFVAVPVVGDPAPIVLYYDAATGSGFDVDQVLGASYYPNYMVYGKQSENNGKLRDTIKFYLQDDIKHLTGKTPAVINSDDLTIQEGIILVLYKDAPPSIQNDAVVKAALGYEEGQTPDYVANREAYYIRSENDRVWIIANTVDGLMSAVPDLLASVGHEVLGMGPNWIDAPDYSGQDLVFDLETKGRANGYLYRVLCFPGNDGHGTITGDYQLTPSDEHVYASFARWRVATRLNAGQSVPNFPGHALDSFHEQVVQRMRETGYTNGFLTANTILGPDANRPAATIDNRDYLWINTDDEHLFRSDGNQWVTQNPSICLSFSLDLSVPWVRQIILEDLKSRSTTDLWNVPDDWSVRGTDPEDGAGYYHFAEYVHYPNWYEDYRASEGLTWGNYDLNGYKGITQSTEYFSNAVADTVFAFNNWLLREYDKWVGTISYAVQTNPNIPTQLTRTGRDRRTMVRCSLYSYNFHDVPPHFNLDPRIRLQVAGFAKHRGVGEWRNIRTREDVAGAFNILLPDEPCGNYAYLTDEGWGAGVNQLPDYIPNWGNSAKAVRDMLAGFTQVGVRSYTAEATLNFGRHGLGYYLMGKYFWDPTLSEAALDTLCDTWLQRAFGPGWQKMKEYYEWIEPAATVDGLNFWAKAISLINEADDLIDNNSIYQKRLDDLKQYWYFCYLLDSGEMVANSPRTQEFLWKGQTSYMTSMYHIARRVFGKNYLHEIAGIYPAFAAYMNGPAHYAANEIQTWWADVIEHFPYTDVNWVKDLVLNDETPANAIDLNDLVSVEEFQNHENEMVQVLIYDSCHRKPVPFYTIARAVNDEIGFKLCWPAQDGNQEYWGPHDVEYAIEHWDTGQRQWIDVNRGIRSSVYINGTDYYDGTNKWLVEVRYQAPEAGAYRITVGHGGACAKLSSLNWDISQWPGPLADDTGPTFSQIQGFDSQYNNGSMYVYIPKGVTSLDFEMWGTESLNRTLTLYTTPLTVSRTLDITARGPYVIELLPNEDGNIAKIQLGMSSFNIPYFYSVPQLWSRSPSALLVPKAIVAADGLTIIEHRGLISHWKLNEGSGLTTADAKSNNDGTVSGGAVWTSAGRIGNALVFDGIDDYVDCGIDEAFQLNAGTISAWIKADVTQHINSRIVCLGTSHNRADLFIRFGHVHFQNPGCEIMSYPVTVNDNTWHHVAATWDETGACLYIDGNLVKKAAGDISWVPPVNPKCYIGECLGGGNYYYKGTMDEVRIYNKALGETEMITLYSQLMSHWKIVATGLDLGQEYTSSSEVLIGISDTASTTPAPQGPAPYSVYMKIKDLLIISPITWYSEDIRQFGQEEERWLLSIDVPDAVKETYPETWYPELSWDPNALCPGGFFSLYSANSSSDSVSLLVADMRKISSYQVQEDDGDYICVVWFTSITIEMDLPFGWSMISLPVKPANPKPSVLFPGASIIYGYDKEIGYVMVTNNETLEAGKGYWILLEEAKEFFLTGQPINEHSFEVDEAGWEMIGGCTSPAVASIESGDGYIVVIYRYVLGSGYQRVRAEENLEPGIGYWIGISGPAKVVINSIQNS